jgi:hypothetical protein
MHNTKYATKREGEKEENCDHNGDIIKSLEVECMHLYIETMGV